MDYIKQAKALKKIGVSVVPLRTDGSKLPKIKWAVYQTRIMADFEIETHFEDCGGVAAITGEISNLYVLDFDLKYQHESQDFWKDFMDKIPTELKKKLFINTTKNNGMHVWMRTDFEDKSRKLTRRASTIPELMLRYEELVKQGKEPLMASEQILKSPFEVVIETRSRGSYAVFYHPEYTRFYGTKLQKLTLEEVELLNETAYSLDYCYQQPRVYDVGGADFSTVRKYNDDADAYRTVSLLEATGMFSVVGTERNGDMKVLRLGSSAAYSGRVFAQTGVFHVFSQNTMFDTTVKNSFSPFEVYMVTKNLTHEQAVKELSKN